MNVRPLRPVAVAAAAAVTLSLTFLGVPAAAKPGGQDPTVSQRQALDAGLQVVPKGSPATTPGSSPNPYLANLPSNATADLAGWQAVMARGAKQRATSSALAAAKRAAVNRVLPPAVVYDETEPVGTSGSNDSRRTAEAVIAFGTAAGENPRVRVLGALADLAPTSRTLATAPEDNGQLDLAFSTGINGVGSITTSGVLGDGPHGSPPGDDSNDFDVYRLRSRAGLTISVDTNASADVVDTIVALYDSDGDLVAADDDGGEGLNSQLSFDVPSTQTFYVLVAGFAADPLPADPNDSGSGAGGAVKGAYGLAVASEDFDRDFFAFDLAKGDVLGATVAGTATSLTVFRPDGRQMVGAPQLDASFLYPPESPLPGGGNTTLAYVAEQSGRYAVEVEGAAGAYDATVEGYRPGSETDQATRVQTVFLDFDGGRVNTAIWGGPGVRTVSPFSAFVAGWGLTRGQEATLIDRITAEVRENIRTDLVEQGLNDDVAVRVINSKDRADPFGAENVSRVIVGGTIEQTGISTIGIAQFIDPGNYEHEDSAIVLLDLLSEVSGEAYSLNTYIGPGSDRVGFVAQGVGNVISHEIGHLIGSYHTDNSNDQSSLMDAGGAFERLYGVGPDGIGGTADDDDVDFVEDTYDLFEGFTGTEDTLNVSAWAFVRDPRVPTP